MANPSNNPTDQQINKVLAYRGFEATISRDKPRGNRKPIRVTWIEEGRTRYEMFDSWELADTHAWAKLKALASGVRTLSREELQDLLAFKSEFEMLQDRLKTIDRSVELAISDLITACDMLPGWRPSQMAEFLVENHLIRNPLKVKKVSALLLKDRNNAKDRDYDPHVIKNNGFRLNSFNREFGDRAIHTVQGLEILNYIMNYRVGPVGLRAPACFDPKVLKPASQGTKRALYSLLKCVFDCAKKRGALRPHSPTVVERLDRPQSPNQSPQTYSSKEIVLLLRAQPDVESMLFVSVQAFSGLWRKQARDLVVSQFVPRSGATAPHIAIETKGNLKDPITGATKTWTLTAPILPPLEDLLGKVELPRGKVFVSKSIEYKVRRAAEEAGLPWHKNGLRNTFLASRLAAGDDLATVAYEAGIRSEDDLKPFIELIEEADARALFRIKVDPRTRPYTSGPISWKVKRS
jgi:hypothetical protein